MELYAALMEEVKIRLTAIEASISGGFALQNGLIREFCFLQLRMICELIALGCLTAHGDIEATTKLRKEWSANLIIERLGALHSTFYPSPPHRTETGLVGINSGYLTKAELLDLVGQCGDVLHRGSLKKLLSPETPKSAAAVFGDIISATKKIAVLLNQHAMLLVDGNTLIICTMRNSNDNGKAQVVFAERYFGESGSTAAPTSL
jgi:hypothetical protein